MLLDYRPATAKCLLHIHLLSSWRSVHRPCYKLDRQSPQTRHPLHLNDCLFLHWCTLLESSACKMLRHQEKSRFFRSPMITLLPSMHGSENRNPIWRVDDNLLFISMIAKVASEKWPRTNLSNHDCQDSSYCHCCEFTKASLYTLWGVQTAVFKNLHDGSCEGSTTC